MHLMFQQYEERLARRACKPNTIANFKRTAALFEESGLDPMTAQDWEIEEWLAGLQCPRTKGDVAQPSGPGSGRGGRRKECLSPRTVRLHFENLRAAYGYAVHRRLLQASPCEMVRLPREPDKEPRILESAELRHILGNCITATQELLILTLMYTGMRRNEIRCLKWDDISPTSIRVVAGKGDKLRHVPMHPVLGELLAPAAEYARSNDLSAYVFPGRGGALMSYNNFYYMLEKVRGDVFCTMHDFRRTVASSLYGNGVDTLIIDKIMGWAPRAVGSRYYIKTADAAMQGAILKLYADDPIGV